jgi:murein L,D-transpeptidase YcbB/YkuD
VLAFKQLPLLHQADISPQSTDLTALYRLNKQKLLWLAADRNPTDYLDALELLRNASSEGLNPANYALDSLQQCFAAAVAASQNDTQFVASCDVGLSVALLRYMHNVYAGRIDPHSLNYAVQLGAKPAVNMSVLLKRHVDQHSLLTLAADLEPKISQYALLKQALAELRQASKQVRLAKLVFVKPLHPGDSDPQLPLLRQHLLNLGILTAAELSSVAETAFLYDEATTAAVMRLQKQQGIEAQGLIGKRTQALLNLTTREKITLIEIAMERLRWLPAQPAGPHIIVNIPAFQLWALHSADDDQALTMKVVVGKAETHQTPLLWQHMRYLEFMPYWNIPKSILDKEILPKLQNAQDYLRKQDIELVENNTIPLAEDPEGMVDDIKTGRLRARQLPGEKNPLGKVKFIFPNKDDIYLHDTPFRWAFNQDRRDFSHGCVRVADAQKLAQFVLDEQQGWDKNSIEQAMATPKTQRVDLTKSIPVMFLYNTAYAGQDKKLRFYPDIYGYDAQLLEAFNNATLMDNAAGVN